MEKNERLDWEEAVEIADILTQTDNPEGDYAISENALLNKWSIDMSTFHEIINGVFKMIDFGISPITQTPFVGISKDKREWIAKKEVSQRSVVYYRKPTTAASSGIFRFMVFGIYHMLQIWCGKHHEI